MNPNPTLSIIIVSFNTSRLVINCLNSILADKKLKAIPHEIIIIDNASTDDSVSKINKLKIKNLKFKTNPVNLGFAKANNQGLKLASGNYILMLNSDTIILHSAISQSLDWLSSHPEAIACSAQLLNSDKTIQPSGGYFPNFLNVFSWSIGLDDLPLINQVIKPLHPHSPSFYTRDDFFLKDHQQDWLTGAFLLIRKSVLDQTGGFDEKYFMYGEEVELCYRIKKEFPQKQIWYLVGPQVIHLGGASAKNRLDPILNEYRGILAFFTKHHSHFSRFVRLILKVNSLFRGIIFTIVHQSDLSSVYFQACSKI